VKGWAQAGPHGFRIAGSSPRSWTLGGRVTMIPEGANQPMCLPRRWGAGARLPRSVRRSV